MNVISDIGNDCGIELCLSVEGQYNYRGQGDSIKLRQPE